MISFAVAKRTREIGIRMAPGGQLSQVVWMVLRHGTAVTMLGVGLDVMGVLALARAAASLINGVSVSDPVTFAAAPAVLMAVGLLATAIPARRAARVNPNLTLRAE